jgi:cyclopropane-fatty-acyl-phospholipid synthase
MSGLARSGVEADLAVRAVSRRESALVGRVQDLVERALRDFPWPVYFQDWTGRRFRTGGTAVHWSGGELEVTLHEPAAGRALVRGDVMGFVEHFLAGRVDLEGNLYIVSDLRNHAHLDLGLGRALLGWLAHRAFQSPARARTNVKSHYDIPQSVFDVYLDRVYRAYSCAIFEAPERLEREELLRVGVGRDDDFDSLEKAQWRKFKEAVDWIAPAERDVLLEIGCGYGGQLRVALEEHRFRRITGWTHSANQIREGVRLLAEFDRARWELREGDYREDCRVYDHVLSTEMVSHVGPRGLVPYVRNVRRRIRRGGRYVHQALMTPHTRLPLDFYPGTLFHKRYVWPGYHWFTLGTHVRALERNGFAVQRALNLSLHYARTTAAWYERMMARAERVRELLGEPTFRAWQLYLAGSSGNFQNQGIHVYRLYCEAV